MPAFAPSPASAPASCDVKLALSAAAFRRAAEFITRELGIKMTAAKLPLLQSRLQRRVRAAGCASLEEYVDNVLRDGETNGEVLEFIDAVTTNKTDFFREPQHFDLLRRTVIPTLDPGRGQSWTLRGWSAGCSSGQEVYTLAMVLAEAAAERPGFDFQLLGTDVSGRMLESASVAIYEAALVQPVPPLLRQKYLLRSRDPGQRHVRIVPELRSRTRFQRLNFMAESYGVGDTFDVIFFRNVMIYFDKATQERVVRRLCDRLRSGGYFFVGHSESLTGLDVPLESLGNAFYRRL